MARRLPPYIFWNVADGHVNGVGRFVTEKCKLGLVGGDDDGNNCRSWTFGLENFLNNISQYDEKDLIMN